MDVKYGKIHRKRIVKSFEIAAYYTLRCIAKKYKTSMRYPFFVGKSERCKVFFRFAVCGLFLSRSPVKILVQIIQFSVESLYVFFSRFIGFLQGFFLGIQSIVIITKLINIKMF